MSNTPGLVLQGLSSSVSAFALANPEASAIAGLIALGVVGATTLTVITYKKWQAYKAKEHKAKMEAVNEFHRQCLQKLTGPGGVSVPGLPPIFQFNADGSVNSLHYNDYEVRALGQILPRDPAELARYREYVRSAILQLKEYYFALKDSDDVTSGVLSYLLNILENRCLSFIGYNYDITYLNALIDFTSKYASQEGTVNSVHFDRLKGVISSLQYAAQDLATHKETMSLLELVNQTRSACQETSNKLLRLQVKLIAPKAYQSFADTVTLENLSKNVLREKHITFEIFGIPLTTLSGIDLPKSIFHNWLQRMAKYYLQSLDPKGVVQGEKILHPEEIYEFIKWAKHALAQKELAKRGKSTPLSEAEEKKLDHGLNLIYRVFHHAPNFITTRLEGDEYVTINDEHGLLNNSELMADLAHLNHAVISLQALSADLTGSMQELGLDFFNNHDNFNKIFSAFNKLYEVIQADLSKVQQKIVDLDRASKNTARLDEERVLEEELKKALEDVQTKVLQAAKEVKNYKNKHPKTTETSEKEALNTAEFFLRLFDPQAEPPGVAPSMEKGPIAAKPVKSLPVSVGLENTPQTVKDKLAALNQLGNNLFAELENITAGRKKDPQAERFQKIYDTLKKLQLKAIQLLEESDKKNVSLERKLKANHIYKFTSSLYEDAIQFFAHPEETRASNTAAFIKAIHAKIDELETKAYIERHNNDFRAIIYKYFGFFPTTTHHRVAEVQQACDSLQKTHS